MITAGFAVKTLRLMTTQNTTTIMTSLSLDCNMKHHNKQVFKVCILAIVNISYKVFFDSILAATGSCLVQFLFWVCCICCNSTRHQADHFHPYQRSLCDTIHSMFYTESLSYYYLVGDTECSSYSGNLLIWRILSFVQLIFPGKGCKLSASRQEIRWLLNRD